jgi:hypothetical protein
MHLALLIGMLASVPIGLTSLIKTRADDWLVNLPRIFGAFLLHTASLGRHVTSL